MRCCHNVLYANKNKCMSCVITFAEKKAVYPEAQINCLTFWCYDTRYKHTRKLTVIKQLLVASELQPTIVTIKCNTEHEENTSSSSSGLGVSIKPSVIKQLLSLVSSLFPLQPGVPTLNNMGPDNRNTE